MWACYKGKNLVVQELVERGANFNIKAEVSPKTKIYIIHKFYYLKW